MTVWPPVAYMWVLTIMHCRPRPNEVCSSDWDMHLCLVHEQVVTVCCCSVHHALTWTWPAATHNFAEHAWAQMSLSQLWVLLMYKCIRSLGQEQLVQWRQHQLLASARCSIHVILSTGLQAGLYNVGDGFQMQIHQAKSIYSEAEGGTHWMWALQKWQDRDRPTTG